MTTHIKHYPFEVRISGDPTHVVLADQGKNLDWKIRKAKRKGTVTSDELLEVRCKTIALIE